MRRRFRPEPERLWPNSLFAATGLFGGAGVFRPGLVFVALGLLAAACGFVTWRYLPKSL
jgi:hypothetical protein